MADKYNVEEAEALAKRTLVQLFPRFYTSLFSRIIEKFPIFNCWFRKIVCFLQQLPITQATPIYEQLLSLYPTSVRFPLASLLCMFGFWGLIVL